LVHLDVAKPADGARAAISATPDDTAAELREVAEDQAMTARALGVLGRSKAGAYTAASALADRPRKVKALAPNGARSKATP
jgi:hypothetical protein